MSANPNTMIAPMISAFLTQRLVAQDAAAIRVKDQACRDKLAERLEALITQWNSQNPNHAVPGKPYNPSEFA